MNNDNTATTLAELAQDGGMSGEDFVKATISVVQALALSELEASGDGHIEIASFSDTRDGKKYTLVLVGETDEEE